MNQDSSSRRDQTAHSDAAAKPAKGRKKAQKGSGAMISRWLSEPKRDGPWNVYAMDSGTQTKGKEVGDAGKKG
ncbi:hypothetical protein PG995_004291 [Apiospora arundinis]